MPGGAFQSQRLTFDVRLVFAANTSSADLPTLEAAEALGQRVANDIHDALKAKFQDRDAYIEPPRGRYRNEPLGGVIDLSITAGVATAPHVLSILQAQGPLKTAIRTALKRKLRRAVDLTRFAQRIRTRQFLPIEDAKPISRHPGWLRSKAFTVTAACCVIALLAVGAVRFSRTPAADAKSIQPALSQVETPAPAPAAGPAQPELAEFLLPPVPDAPPVAEAEAAPAATPAPRRHVRHEPTCRRYTSERSGYVIIRCS